MKRQSQNQEIEQKDIEVLDKAKEVKAKTEEILKEINVYKKELIERTGGYDEETHTYVGQKDIDASSTLFVNEGQGDILRDKLNGYSSYLRKATGDSTISPIAKDAKDIPVFASDPNQRAKGFSELNFGHNTPMVGALASLSQFQSDVLAEETKALESLARAVGAEDLKFDEILPMVNPESRIVAAGTRYTADMFIAASSSAVVPTMKVDGKDIEVIDGQGKVSFIATAGKYDKEGNAKKSFVAAISLKLPGGRDTTFVDTVEYIVSKPVMQIQSASVQALFLNCGNELNIQVPALGNAYNPSFKTTGGTSIPGSTKGSVTIVPKSAKVTLSVSSNGNLIGTQEFKVKTIPKPEIIVVGKGGPVNLKRGLKGLPRSLKLTAQADKSFSDFLPKDSRFIVSAAEVTLVRLGRAVKSVRTKKPTINLSSMASLARAGDVLVIDVKQVKRKNFKSEVENFKRFAPKLINVSIN